MARKTVFSKVKYNFLSKAFLFLCVSFFMLLTQNSYAQCTGPANDCDNDGVVNSLDLDDDNDGILDTDEENLEQHCLDFSGIDDPSAGSPNFSGRTVSHSSGYKVTYSGTLTDEVYLNGATNNNRTPQGNTSGDLRLGVIDGLGTTNYEEYTINFDKPTKLKISNKNILGGLFDDPDHWDITVNTGSYTVNDPGVADLENVNITGANITFDGTASAGTESWEINTTGFITSMVLRMSTLNNSNNLSPIRLCALLPQDTDRDGIPNYLDTDSDNDGCFDALEGDGGILFGALNSNGSINTTSNPVNDNGIPVGPGTAGNGTTGQTDNSNRSTNSAVQSIECAPCSPASSQFVDTDNDTIGDACDLDDDNDGILDTDECNIVTNNFTITGGDGGSTTTFAFDRAETANFDFDSVDNSLEILVNDGKLNANNILQLFGTAGVDEVFLEFLNGTDMGTPWIANSNGLPRLRVLIDAAGVVSITGTRSTTSTALEPMQTRDGSSFNTIRFLSGVNNFSVENIDGPVTDAISGTATITSACFDIDTDNDTIPNHLDTDSDNDGCFDALEGDGGILFGALNSNGSINTTSNPVNDNGIPVGPGTAGNGTTGQTDSSNRSTNSSVQGIECDECNSASSQFVDTDNDTIGDACDLDDDNDGILDTDECNIITNNFTITGGDGGSTTTFVSDRAATANFDFDSVDNSLEILVNDGKLNANNILQLFGTAGVDEVFLEFLNGTDMGTPWIANSNGLPRLRVLIDAAGVVSITGTRSTTSTALEPMQTRDGSSFNTIRFLSGVNNFSVENIDGPVTDAISGTATITSACFDIDTDNDTIPDHLDTDSDNDGCPDAIEANGTITQTQLTTLPDGSAVPGSLDNLGTVSASNGSPLLNATDTVGFVQLTAVAVTDALDASACNADLSLTKTVDKAIVKIGDTIVYTLTIKNDGPNDALNVNVTDILPTGVTYQMHTVSRTDTTYEDSDLNSVRDLWNIGTLNLNETITLQITATINGAGVIINKTQITQVTQADPDSEKNNGN